LPATRHRDDEIGRLAEEFERMVAALAARDDSLHEASRRLVQSERLAAIGRMAAHVTHEVRNPLSSIGLNVEMLEEELAQSGSETRDLLKAIHREIDSLTAVTEEYLRLARMPNPRLEPEHLGDTVQSTAQFLRPELERHGMSLAVEVAEGLPLVALDENQIRQVLLNLIKNAREAMSEGGRVALAVSARDGGVVVSVADDGAGMDEARRERLFDLFFTTKELGTGLGLPLSQQIVLAHRGHIRCQSAPGEGTVFELWFPAHEAVVSERPLAAASA
jgi:signal transduction histidine kinase